MDIMLGPQKSHILGKVMSSGLAQQQSRLKELISRGREQGYLTYGEVNDFYSHPNPLAYIDIKNMRDIFTIALSITYCLLRIMDPKQYSFS